MCRQSSPLCGTSGASSDVPVEFLDNMRCYRQQDGSSSAAAGRNLKQWAQTDVLLCLLQRNRESRERFWMPAHLEDLHKGVQSKKQSYRSKYLAFLDSIIWKNYIGVDKRLRLQTHMCVNQTFPAGDKNLHEGGTIMLKHLPTRSAFACREAEGLRLAGCGDAAGWPQFSPNISSKHQNLRDGTSPLALFEVEPVKLLISRTNRGNPWFSWEDASFKGASWNSLQGILAC